MNFPIALQLYSVRDDMQKDFEGTLRAVKAMGYDGVEFAGLFGKTAEEVKSLLENIGLVPVSAHVALAEINTDPEKIFDTYAAIGCKYIAIPYLPEELRPGKPGFDEVIEQARDLGKLAASKGLQLLYHNHDFEFCKVGDEYALDMLYRVVPADCLATEIDTCWVNVGGENPANYVRKYTGRAPVVHLKDFVMPGKKPAQLYELIGIESKAVEDEPSTFEFRPVGQGVQDFPAILAAAEDAGTAWVVVEQDAPSQGKVPMQCVRESIEYLRSL